MAITLAYGGVTVNLPPDMDWSDEYDWHPVVQTKTYTTTGALLIESATKQAGRPFTLQKPQEGEGAWITRDQCDELKIMAAVPGAVLTLTIRGVMRPVMFDHEAGNAFEARPVVFFEDLQPGDWYVPTLRLIEV